MKENCKIHLINLVISCYHVKTPQKEEKNKKTGDQFLGLTYEKSFFKPFFVFYLEIFYSFYISTTDSPVPLYPPPQAFSLKPPPFPYLKTILAN